MFTIIQSTLNYETSETFLQVASKIKIKFKAITGASWKKIAAQRFIIPCSLCKQVLISFTFTETTIIFSLLPCLKVSLLCTVYFAEDEKLKTENNNGKLIWSEKKLLKYNL